MMSSYRVHKRKTETGQVRKRGRPKKYSESWTKKLLLLRMCGLNLNDIVRALEIQGGGTFTAKDRRPQQLVRQLLSDGKHRFSTPDRLTARKRAAFIRATVRSGGSRCQRPASATSSVGSLSQDHPPDAKYPQTEPTSPPRMRSRLSGKCAAGLPTQWPSQSPGDSNTCSETLQERQRLSEFEFFTPDSSDSPSTNNPQTTPPGFYEPEVQPESDTTSPDWSIEGTNNRDSTVLIPSRKYRIREAFSQNSFSSSFVSDLLSLIEKRFSLSTFETSSRRSVSVMSLAETEMSFSEGKAAEILDQTQQIITKANVVLTRDCCSKTKDCRHRYIEGLIRRDPYLVLMRPGDLKARLHIAPVMQQPLDPYGNSELFFASRVGAPADVILSLIQVTTDVNAVNADGQTFLFFLSTTLFSNRYCSCSGPRAHASKFECLIRFLERRNFDFDHLDNHGRHFLSFLCSTESFDIEWLSDLMARDNEWQQRVWRVAQLRDATGVFLIDFMALHPKFDAMGEDVRAHFRPLFVHNPAQADQSGFLSDEDEQGRTRLHQYVQREFLHTAPLHEVPLPFDVIASDINRYNVKGRTLLMDLLLQASDQDIDESFICAKVQQLIRCGANVNARSRGGSTILHFAAKKALPKLLEILLATNIQVDHCDNAGCSALDYAARVFNRSRTIKAPAELTARSLKSTAHLLGVVSNVFGRDRVANDARGTKDIDERSLQTLQKLLGHDGQSYPPSVLHGVRRSPEIIALPALQS